MKILITAVALAALTVTSAAAQTQTTKKKQSAAQAQQTQPHRYSPSGHPEWDVYVRGEYVGSDPDPRVRASIRSDAKRNYNAGR